MIKLSINTTIKIKAVISSILLLSFAITTITGVGLYVYSSGLLHYFSRNNFLGFSKHQLKDIHTTRGFIMSGIVIIHLLFNFKMFITELKILFKRGS